MTRFEQVQWAAMYALVHASAIVVVVEAVKLGGKVLERPLGRFGKVGLPVVLGVTSFFVCPLVVHLMGAQELVCFGAAMDSEICADQLMRASFLWWILVSASSMGVFSVFQLVKDDLLSVVLARVKALK